MAVIAANHHAYKRVDVETASQGKLIVMLYNGAIQRADEARRQIERGRLDMAHNNLLKAQAIIGELRSALNMSAGELAVNLDRSYEYFQHLLIKANLRKDTQPIEECVELMSQLRDTWQELFEQNQKEAPVQPLPALNTHGAAVLNLQG